MRVVYVGDFTRTWHTETHVAREMEALGHRVQRLAPGFPLPDLVDVCAGADLLLQQGSQLPPEFITDSWCSTIERAGTTTAAYHLDLYRGITEREALLDTQSMWRMQHVFTADGDPWSAKWFGWNGVNHHWLPGACVSDEIGRGTYRDEFATDVVFVGKVQGYHRAWPWRQELVAHLAQRYGDRFKVYDHTIRDRALNDLYASAMVVVGDSMFAGQRQNYWSDRYYETLGRGGALVAPRINCFLPGIHYLSYEPGQIEGVFSHIDFLLDNEPVRTAMQQWGMDTVRFNHTYKHRAEEMFDVMELA